MDAETLRTLALFAVMVVVGVWLVGGSGDAGCDRDYGGPSGSSALDCR